MRCFSKRPDISANIAAFAEKQDALDQRISFLEAEQMRSRRTSLLAAELANLERTVPKDKGKRILVAGWYGADNLGDELMLRAVLEYLSNDALQRTSVLLWDNSTYDRLDLSHAVHTLHYPATTRELDFLVDSFDIVIWGGGAILDETQFNDDANNVNTGNLFIRTNELMLSRGKHVFCLGLSATPKLENPEYISRLARIVEKADHFSLRDKHSLDALRESGINPLKLSLCEDLAFSLPGLAELAGSKEDSENFVIGFVPIFSEAPIDIFAETILNVVNELKKDLSKKTIEALLVPFLNEGHFDERKNAELQNKLQQKGVQASVAAYTYSPELSGLRACNAVISYKYHAALLACCFGIPCLMVSSHDHPHYPNKMSHLAKLASVPLAHISDNELINDPVLQTRILLEVHNKPHISKQIYEQAQQYMTKICETVESL